MYKTQLASTSLYIMYVADTKCMEYQKMQLKNIYIVLTFILLYIEF